MRLPSAPLLWAQHTQGPQLFSQTLHHYCNPSSNTNIYIYIYFALVKVKIVFFFPQPLIPARVRLDKQISR